MVRGRPIKLNTEVKNEILRIRRKHPGLTLQEIQNNLRSFLYKSIRDKHPNWTDKEVQAEVIESLPGVSAIQKYLKTVKAKENSSEYQENEQLWHLGLLSKLEFLLQHPEINSEAINRVFEVQKWAERNRIQWDGHFERYGVTVRQVLWIARLYNTVEKSIAKGAEHLWRVSYAYSAYEIMCILSGTDINTWELDTALRQGDAEFRKMIQKLFISDTATRSLMRLQLASETKISEVKNNERSHSQEE